MKYILFLFLLGCSSTNSKKETTSLSVSAPEAEIKLEDSSPQSEIEDWSVSPKGFVKTGKSHSCNLSSTPPYLEDGCMGEACGIIRYDRSMIDINVYEKADEYSKVVDVLKKCERFSEADFKLMIHSYGSGYMNDSPDYISKAVGEKINIGDKVVYHSYDSEGEIFLCIHDQLVGYSTYGLYDITLPKIDSWVYLKTPRGIKGYVRDKDSEFYMGCHNGDESKTCFGESLSKSCF